LKYLKQINIQTKAAEKQLESSVRNEELHALLRLEKCLVYFTTSLRGNDILIHRLKNMRGAKEIYDPDLVEDVEIESKQALEQSLVYSEVLSGMMDAYASVISNNLNIVMKRLTSVSLVLMMPTLIASFLGMNLEEGTTIFNWGFWLAVGISLLITLFAVVFMVKKKWF
jgi:magnesium transporter